jgi:tetratricopeptide (TPR) repeat protein
MLLANKALTNRSLDSALVWLQTAERLHGDPAAIELLRARINRRLGDLTAMETHLKLAVKFGAPAIRISQERMLATAQAGRLHEVEDALKRWLENPGEDGADLCDAYTNGLASQGRLTETELLLNAWESGFPLDPKPHVKRGRIAEHALAYEAAEAEYRAALKKNPEYPTALYALGRLLLDRKRPAEALPMFRRCAEVSSGAAVAARVGEGSCLRSLGDVTLARQVLEAVVSSDENSLDKAYLQIGFRADGAPAALELGKLESSEQNYIAAEKWLRRAVTADPYDLDARYAWAVALRGIDRKQEAAAEFEHVSRVRKLLAETEAWQTHLAEHPDDIEIRYKVAMTYMQHSSPKSGIYWLQSVLAHDPTHEPTHRALADYYETHKDEVASYPSLAEYHRRMISHDSH